MVGAALKAAGLPATEENLEKAVMIGDWMWDGILDEMNRQNKTTYLQKYILYFQKFAGWFDERGRGIPDRKLNSCW